MITELSLVLGKESLFIAGGESHTPRSRSNNKSRLRERRRGRGDEGADSFEITLSEKNAHE